MPLLLLMLEDDVVDKIRANKIIVVVVIVIEKQMCNSRDCLHSTVPAALLVQLKGRERRFCSSDSTLLDFGNGQWRLVPCCLFIILIFVI